MKIIIDKDKELQKLKDMLPNLTDKKDVQSVNFAINVIEGIDGTPLPKGHGRLIDESKITKCYMPVNQFDVRGIRTDAPTILEADKEG